jgi:hypothetical protein
MRLFHHITRKISFFQEEPMQAYRYAVEADSLEIPTMIFIGEHEQHQRRRSIETAVKSMKESGKRVRLIVYPGTGRNSVCCPLHAGR